MFFSRDVREYAVESARRVAAAMGINPPAAEPERCVEGALANTADYKWLAVPPSRLHQFVGGSAIPVAQFLQSLRDVARRHPEQASVYEETAEWLEMVPDEYPGYHLFVVKVA